MFELQIKILPEEEFMKHIQESQEIKSYCSGDKGLLIYSSSNKERERFSSVDTYQRFDGRIVEIVKTNNKNIISFDCNCATNPINSFRRLIQQFNGNIMDPVILRYDWEYVTVLFDSEKQTRSFLEKLNELMDYILLSLEKTDEIFLLKIKNNLKQIFTNLTDKQKESLLLAWKKGYYTIPRAIKTEELAKEEQISRFAFEKKLRKAENSLIDNIIPLILLYDNKMGSNQTDTNS